MALGPAQAYTGPNTRLRWTSPYASDAVNKAFIGMPKGVYLGFTPVISGLALTLQRDTALVYSAIVGSYVVGTTVTGGSSGATAVIRLIHDGLPDGGFMNVESVVGVFEVGEPINGPGVTSTLEHSTSDDISLAKVATTSSYGGNRTEEAVTVVVGKDIDLDFAPGSITDGHYFVILSVAYEVGEETVAQVTSRKFVPADDRLEIGLCRVTKFGGALILSPITDENRTNPYADNVTRIGFMPAGAVDDLSNALLTVQEITASRIRFDGTNHGSYDPSQPLTTGLPGRINSDLERANMSARMGKETVIVQGNDVSLQAVPSGNTINISGSFAAKARTSQPFRDVTNGDLPTGVNIPIFISPTGYDGQTLTVSNASGGFIVGNKILGTTSGGSSIIRGVSGDTIDIDDQGLSFYVGEDVESAGITATITAIDLREGAITAPEGSTDLSLRNLVSIQDTFTGKKPTSASGDPIYGRLLFGPSGSFGVGGGDAGELLVATGAGEQINYTNGSTAITNNNLDFTEYLQPGDIIEGDDGRFYEIDSSLGAVQTGNLFLASGNPYVGPNSSAGLDVGSGPRRRLRYLMKLVTLTGGVEADAVIDVGSIPSGAGLRPFFAALFTGGQSHYDATLSLSSSGDAHSVQAPGSVVPGVGYNAASGPTKPIVGSIKTVQVDGVDIGAGNFHTINYSTGTIVETAPGVVSIESLGPTGPQGGPGASPSGPAGDRGIGFDNIFSTLPAVTIGPGPLTTTHVFDFAPRKLRFYMLTTGMLTASGSAPVGRITGVVTPTIDTDTSVTVAVTVDSGQSLVIYCAAATD